MMVKAAPRLATILWLQKASVDVCVGLLVCGYVPLVGQLDQSQSRRHISRTTGQRTLAMPMGVEESAMVWMLVCGCVLERRNEWQNYKARRSMECDTHKRREIWAGAAAWTRNCRSGAGKSETDCCTCCLLSLPWLRRLEARASAEPCGIGGLRGSQKKPPTADFCKPKPEKMLDAVTDTFAT